MDSWSLAWIINAAGGGLVIVYEILVVGLLVRAATKK